MADAAAVQVWKDVTDQLNARQGGWSQSFKASRKYKPKAKFEEVDQVVVQTALSAWRVSQDNRTDWAHQFDVDIGILYRPPGKAGDQPVEKYDSLLKLAEEITDYWETTRAANADCPLTAIRFGPAPDAPWIPEWIEEHNCFASVITLTFWKLRDPNG